MIKLEDIESIVGPFNDIKNPSSTKFDAYKSYLVWSACPHLFTKSEAIALSPLWGKEKLVTNFYKEKDMYARTWKCTYVPKGIRRSKRSQSV